jgi:copper resistance protein C
MHWLRFRVVLLSAVALLATFAVVVQAHAILKASSPATGASLAGPNVPISLTFNVRVDADRSKLQLLLPDASTIDLPLEKQSGADKLDSRARDLKPGAYKIRWQVLAPDGHISRGEIPFQVTAP